MLYLGIDQHRKQLTVNLRNEAGEVILRRQVSTEWARVREFLEDLKQRSVPEEGFVAIVEVCGFNDWLLKLLAEYGCRETVLVQPEKQSKKKTDRRDANALGELLWVNRQRLLAGLRVQGVRRVVLPDEAGAEDRQLTEFRKRLGQSRTRTINRVKHVLRKHNLEQECPTKGLDTLRARKWLVKLVLRPIDRLELDSLLAQWDLWDAQIQQAEREIKQRVRGNATACVVGTMPGAGPFGSLASAARIGRIGASRGRRTVPTKTAALVSVGGRAARPNDSCARDKQLGIVLRQRLYDGRRARRQRYAPKPKAPRTSQITRAAGSGVAAGVPTGVVRLTLSKPNNC